MVIEGINKKNITLVVIIVCIIVVVVGYEILGFSNRGDIIVEQPKVEEVKKVEDNIEVYIIGCVKNPGTYEVPRGVTVGKIADKAGGFTEGADLDKINLVYKIKDNRMIVIKDKKEREEREREYRQRSNMREIEKSVYSKSRNKARHTKDKIKDCDDELDEFLKKDSLKRKKTSGAQKSSNKKKIDKRETIDDGGKDKETSEVAEENTKIQDEISFSDVTSVDEVSKEDIPICANDVDGSMEFLPQKKKVSIGEQDSGMEVVEGLYVGDRIDEKEIININTATKEELVKLSGVGESMADKIIKYREENGDFKNIDELKLVSGMGENKFNRIKDDIDV